MHGIVACPALRRLAAAVLLCAGLPARAPLLAVAAVAAEAEAGCQVARDCFLNGECQGGECHCHQGWTGPHCGALDLLPTPPGPLGGKVFPPQADASCWGSSAILGEDGKFHMYSSGILGNCGLAVWAANAALTHSVSDTLDGHFLGGAVQQLLTAWQRNCLSRV